MAIDPHAPCIIGVARHTWRPGDVGPAGAPEPLDQWEQVARDAASDVGMPGVLSSLESIQVVNCLSWQYDDPVMRLADRLQARPRHRVYTGLGGTVPQVIVADAAREILNGHLDLSLVVGGEALATLRRYRRDNQKPTWSHPPKERPPFPSDLVFHPAEITHSIYEAFLTFAIFDNARRSAIGRGLIEHRETLGETLSKLTKCAASSPQHAWFPTSRTVQEIITPTPENRMVAYPYTKLMVAIMDVDMAAALVVSSHQKADQLGVPIDQRVYLNGYGYAQDPDHVAERRDLSKSLAMAAASERAFRSAQIGVDDVAHFDLYSCFASSLAFATDALGISDHADSRSLTVTGGLPYHGGPGNNYMTHSIAAMVEKLRSDPDSYGLVSGVGMHMAKHAYGIWSTNPPDVSLLREALDASSQHASSQPPQSQLPQASPLPITSTYKGDATVAAYSVLHGRDGSAQWGAVVCDLPDGSRCYSRLEHPDDLERAEREEIVGSAARLTPDENGVNRAKL
jgi:acetyl-CoA C-acetyltransferase